MSNVTRLTEKDKARIEQLAAQGLRSSTIAKTIRRAKGTVSWYMYTAGLIAPRTAPAVSKSYVRRGRTVHRYTADEDTLITTLRLQSFSLETIAEQCTKRFGTDRTPHSIKVRLIMLAAREDAA